MRLLVPALSLAACLIACASNGSKENKNGDETATPGNAENEWSVLFDGSNINSWHSYGGGAAGTAWRIVDSALVLDTSSKINGRIKGGGDLVTNEAYDNFDLKLEWKISPKGNSGILFYVVDDSAKFKAPYETGPEMQVLDNDGHHDGTIIKHRSGDLYDLIACNKETVKPVGEWNQVEIISKDGNLQFWLNGTNVVNTTLWDENWKQMIAKSKFAQWGSFGTAKKGHICLQDHGNMVSFKNIMIKKL